MTRCPKVVAIAMSVCAVISSTLKYEGICGETTTSVATAEATKLSHITVGMFSGAAFFELGKILHTLKTLPLTLVSHCLLHGALCIFTQWLALD